MPVYSDKFLLTQVGRTVTIHYDTPAWETGPGRRRPRMKVGTLVGVQGMQLVIRPLGEDHPLLVEREADQPAFMTREAVWWEWTSAQIPVPPDFQDE